ncbi:transglycosylase domain-containing protein [Pseudonocardia nigra]|uniref:transglycosylase domain-containing protein n=1 Tax=Pseudonocardia nigra TaxID=1921578 RepID=UPI001C605FEE|nr:biosynthetic peptidoglycan transglycosylase [Pseudonocardia nigra]
MAAGTLVAAVLVVPAAGVSRVVAAPLPEGDAAAGVPDPAGTPLASVITDATGAPIARLYDQYRIPTDAGEISDAMKAAVVAIEDRRFFEHGGVDWAGVARALVTNLVTSGAPFDGQGASTITMSTSRTTGCTRSPTPSGSARPPSPTP